MIDLYKNIPIGDYSYQLPDERIAKYPKTSRDESKLLYCADNELLTTQFNKLSELLNINDMLVFNNAKVIQARIAFQKETGANIEIFCLEPHLPKDYNLAFQAIDQCEWKCLVGNLKRWKNGALSKKIKINNCNYILEAIHLGKEETSEIIKFKWSLLENNPDQVNLSFGDLLETIGSTPLPPYLNREAEITDKTRYQTIYAIEKGSVAAPTAGLHFTKEVFESLNIKGISTQNITLHVSAGTFRPVKSETIEGHDMHEEHFEINKETLIQLINHKGRIIAVGTTSARTLESIYRIGAKLISKCPDPFRISQWEVYDEPINTEDHESFFAILKYMDENEIQTLKASTRIIIVPGYKFKVIGGLITNFHQPQSTLLLLIAAAVGEKWREIYNYALANDYRFLSYGDSSLLLF